MQLNTSTTNPTLQISAIQQIASAVTGLLPATTILINGLTSATVNAPATEAVLQTALGGTGLYPLKASAAAIATCTTPYIPAGNYTNLNAGLTGAPRPSFEYFLTQGPGSPLHILEAHACRSLVNNMHALDDSGMRIGHHAIARRL